MSSGRLVCCLVALTGVGVPAGAADPAVDFARDVAPILERACVRCHQPGAAKGGLSLATAAGLLDGGHVVPGKPATSGLLDVVSPGTDGKRPRMPKDGKPLTAAEVAVLRWWVAAGAVWPKDVVIRAKAKADRSWWSLRPLAEVTPPSPDRLPTRWVANPIDMFVVAKLKEKGLTPSPPADPRTLVRRLSYDLTGLPPMPERVEAFAKDPSPAAYEKLVDELLASPQYGEHWGRHWLDVVRFGESTGFERNVIIDNAWPFRDYVIRSFNADKPFDRFIREHLAGDVLAAGDADAETGTGFLVAGPYDNVGNQDAAQAAVIRANTLDDVIRATGEAFLGVTVGCARCHDHKFDPITQQDYYRLYATFAGVVHGTRVVGKKQPAVWVGSFRPANGPFHVFQGGDPKKKGDPVAFTAPGFLADVAPGYELPPTAAESKRRAALAEWVVAADNPLTPRVLANRVWQYHFGTGIVDTPSDFGYMGGKPSHPELLDWLARRLHADGWRLKPLHRLIVTSQAYRQASVPRPDAAAVDGDNRLLWRLPPRRLTGEEVRDSMLAVSGKLDPKTGGPGFRLYKYVQDNVATYLPLDAPGPETYRRAVYHQNARASRVYVLSDFDCPDPAASSPRRPSTTTPLQALTLFNHKFTLDMAAALAERAVKDAPADPVARVFALAYSRPPTAAERTAAAKVADAHGLRAVCRAVLNANQFLYVD
jgi:hypothetical protein